MSQPNRAPAPPVPSQQPEIRYPAKAPGGGEPPAPPRPEIPSRPESMPRPEIPARPDSPEIPAKPAREVPNPDRERA